MQVYNIRQTKDIIIKAYKEMYNLTDVHFSPRIIIRFSDGELEAIYDSYVNTEDNPTSTGFLNYILELQGGHLLVMDRTNPVHEVTKQKGVYLVCRLKGTATDFIIYSDKNKDKNYSIRHIFFGKDIDKQFISAVSKLMSVTSFDKNDLTWSISSPDFKISAEDEDNLSMYSQANYHHPLEPKR